MSATIWKRITFASIAVLWVVGIGYTLSKPVHLDETNFLAMVQGEFWRPHNILINWEGQTQRAFDVLSNPPGMVWLLWPLKNGHIWLMRLWVLPWLILAIWGMYKIASIWNKGQDMLLLCACSPFLAISATTLMPDMVLFACVVVGIGPLIALEYSVSRDKQIPIYASVFLGLSPLFRYSGLALLPVSVLWLFYRKPTRYWLHSLIICVPTMLLCAHDLCVYGQWHFWHMIAFQQEQASFTSFFHKILAFSAMLLGYIPCVLGIGGWWLWQRNMRISIIKIVSIVVVLVCFLGVVYDHQFIEQIDGLAIGWNILCIVMGCGLILQSIQYFWKQKQYIFVLWLVGGCVFLLSLRFAATRYWVPFVVPVYIYTIQEIIPLLEKKILYILGMFFSFLSWGLAGDDMLFAQAQQMLVQQSKQACVDIQQRYTIQDFYYAGHWGFQYYFEIENWKIVENDTIIPNNVCSVRSLRSWPQETLDDCWQYTEILTYSPSDVLLYSPFRVHSPTMHSNYHSYMISDSPPIPTFAPWAVSYDMWDQVLLRVSCNRR